MLCAPSGEADGASIDYTIGTVPFAREAYR
jgi:hypothetical protein